MNKSSRVLGGSSLWGAMVDTVLSKYGWTMDYLLWEISYINIIMLITDSISVYPIRDKEDDRTGSTRVNNNTQKVSFSEFMQTMKQIKG